ncbi:MAG: M23 family metallopeptidase [Candidatus Anstonellales archaeon]
MKASGFMNIIVGSLLGIVLVGILYGYSPSEVNLSKVKNISDKEKFNINEEIDMKYSLSRIPDEIVFPRHYKEDVNDLTFFMKLGILKYGKNDVMLKVKGEPRLEGKEVSDSKYSEEGIEDIRESNSDKHLKDEASLNEEDVETNLSDSSKSEVVKLKNLYVGIVNQPIDSGKYRISSRFGVRVLKDFYDGKPHLHRGIDLACKEGTPVKSIADGEVLDVFKTVEGGNTLIIKHGDKVKSLYAHLKEVKVKKGDKVKSGDVVALSGNTGTYTTGPHLHFELRYEDIPVNPEEYIKFN